MSKILKIILILILIPGQIIFAQATNSLSDLGIQPITIPFFQTFDAINPKFATVFSWVAFAGNVLIVLLVSYWIVRILLVGVEAIRSQGDSDKLKEVYSKLQSNFVGFALTFMVPIILTVVGSVIGIGSIFNWPRMLGGCNANVYSMGISVGGKYDYYFQAYFSKSAADSGDPAKWADSHCGVTSAN